MGRKKILAEWYKDLGSDQIYCKHPQDRRQEGKEAPAASKVEIQQQEALNLIQRDEGAARLAADNSTTLEELRQAVIEFEGCAIKKMALNTVFADGNPNSEVMFVGEAPGANEDQQGIPFCGQSGKLLDNILASIGLSRQNAYITNTIFWRPPGNRRPTPEELALCRPFVEKHIALVAPKLIILVGSTAVESLLASKTTMHSSRQEYYEYTNRYLSKAIKAAVIFHPAYLLRQSLKKKNMWLDMQRIKHELIDASY